MTLQTQSDRMFEKIPPLALADTVAQQLQK